MIALHRIDKHKELFYLNHKNIQRIKVTPETLLILEDGKKILVCEKPEEVIKLITEFEAKVISFSNLIREEEGS